MCNIKHKSTITVAPLLMATLNRGHPPTVAKHFCCCYYKYLYFSLSSKATSLMWSQFLCKSVGLIRVGLL